MQKKPVIFFKIQKNYKTTKKRKFQKTNQKVLSSFTKIQNKSLSKTLTCVNIRQINHVWRVIHDHHGQISVEAQRP